MENTPEELETQASSSKDMWLFLIVLDVIFLCIFGFFLYKHFTAQVLNPAAPSAAKVVKAHNKLPAIEGEEVLVTENNIVENTAAAPVVEPQEKPQPQEKPVAQPQAPAETVPAEAPAKQSIQVAPIPTSSKYRRVTFKWFEPAETVAIVSGFTNRKPQALKKVGDHWETSLSIAPGTYKFLYIVDGKNTVDPYAEQKDGRSVLVVK